MATISKSLRDGKVYWSIEFRDEQKRRKAIWISGTKFAKQTVMELRNVVEKLLYCRNNDLVPDKKVVAWIQSAHPDLQEKLAKVGLIEQPSNRTCQELWDAFLATKTGVKDATLDTYEDAKRRFFLFFKKDESLQDLTQARMLQMKTTLLTTLAEATVAGAITKMKAVFNWAKAQEWIETSPLDGVGRGSFVNRKNDRFVTMDEYRRLLERCPCQEWRVILALARIGALRCPSEVLRLRWSDVDFECNRFFVASPKTEHHQGKEGRLVPLFPELRSELQCLLLQHKCETRENHVINRYRNSNTNLGTQFARIVKMAGLEPIKRPYDNMRMSRSNEIYSKWGAFKESQWIGHSSRVRADHYLMMTDEDFADAANWSKESAKPEKENENGEKTA